MRASFYLLIGGFLTGVAIRSLTSVSPTVLVWVLVLAATGALLWYVFRERVLGYGALFLLVCVGGFVRMEFAHQSFAQELVFHDGAALHAEGVVIDEPDVREAYTLLRILLSEDDTVLRLRVPHHPGFTYGDRVAVRGVVRVPDAFMTETGRVFHYDTYLMKEGVHYELAYAEVTLLDGSGGNAVVRGLFAVKQAWLAAIARVVPEPSASLLGGVVLGAKQSLGEVWLERFRETGIVHIVVLSGYNLTLVAIFMVWCAQRLPRRTQLAFGMTGIGAFAIMTGLGATVVRASIMAVLALLAQFAHRPYHLIRALLLAAFLMVLVNPFVLLFDAGFQLSVIATAGLVLGAPRLVPHLTWVPSWFSMREIVAATLATQLAVLPLLLFHIGDVSLIAPVVNVLVLPLIPIVMAVGFATGLIALVTPLGALPLAYITHLLLSYVFLVVAWAARIPLASIEVPPVPAVLVLAVYGVAFFFLARTAERTHVLGGHVSNTHT